MALDNALAPLLRAASRRYRRHGSPMAAILADSLAGAVRRPVVEAAQVVGPCRALPGILAGAGDPLLAEVTAAAPLLHWRRPGRGRIPGPLSRKMAAVEIVGPDGMIRSDACRWGLFVQSPDVDYPEHCHEAEELYLVLSGTAGWGTETKPPAPVTPGTFIHHPSWLAHIMVTGAEPLLAMWGWTGNLDFATYTMGRRPV